MIARLPILCAMAMTSACSTAQMTSPATIAAISAGAQCIGSFIDLYDMNTQIRATMAEHQRLASIASGLGN